MLRCTMKAGRTETEQTIIFNESKIIQKGPHKYLTYPNSHLHTQLKAILAVLFTIIYYFK